MSHVIESEATRLWMIDHCPPPDEFTSPGGYYSKSTKLIEALEEVDASVLKASVQREVDKGLVGTKGGDRQGSDG